MVAARRRTATMKTKLATSIRHALTSLPALGTYLATKGWLSPAEGAQLDGSLDNLYAVIAALLAAVLVRLIMLAVARFAPGLAPLLGNDTEASGGNAPGGGMSPALLISTAAALSMVGALPSCSVVGWAATGQPPAATSVQRIGAADATPILVASADLAQAEAATEAAATAGEAPPIHGLYDAGRAADAVRSVFSESSK